MILAVDYDGTWTREPAVFRRLVEAMRDRGHTPVLVTGRSDEGRWGAEVRREIGDLMPIIFAAGGWKIDALRRWMEREDALGAHVVWIDDQPQYVGPQDPRLIANREPFADTIVAGGGRC